MTAPVLVQAQSYLRERVALKAQEIDQDHEALREAFDGLFERGLMALQRPAAYGGPGLSSSEYRDYQIEVARTSGTLAFLQTQHQSVVSMIAGLGGEEIRQAYLPGMSHGRFRVGFGFSQLRRKGKPMVTAARVDGGYRIDGLVPWVTGLSYYDEFVIGAELADGQQLFGIVPFARILRDGGKIELSEPMRLAAMEIATTVQATVENWFLPLEKVVHVAPSRWLTDVNDRQKVVSQGYFAIGCALAGVDAVRAASERKPLPVLSEAADALEAEIVACRMSMDATEGNVSNLEWSDLVDLRAKAIELAGRCGHAGVIANSGAANALSHRAQRVYREAIVFSVSGQTTEILEASLKRLMRRSAPQA